jgi:hypothetical protein
MLEHGGSVVHKGNGGVKLMGTAAQRLKLRARGQTIGRFGKSFGSERQSLVGAKDKPAGMRFCNHGRFLARQQSGDCDWRLRNRVPFESALVEIGRAQLDRNAGRFEQRPARGAARRQYEGGWEQAKRPSFKKPNDGGAR